MTKRVCNEEYISGLLSLTSSQYEKAKPEIKTVYDRCFEIAEEEFSIFDEVLRFSEAIEGVAYKYSRASIPSPDDKLKVLKSLKLTSNGDFVFWFSNHHVKYREYSLYIIMLESLRHTLIDELESVIASSG